MLMSITRKGEVHMFESSLTDAQAREIVLANNPSSFALDMAQATKPSEKQRCWLHYLALEAQAPHGDSFDYTPVVELFNVALASGLKRPRVTIDGLKLSLASARSRNPGHVYIVRRKDDQYLGKIAPDGKLVERGMTDAERDWLRRLANDPATTAKDHGRATNSCCFCAKELTNNVSVVLGYGPICAEKWGLPHGYEQSNAQAIYDDVKAEYKAVRAAALKAGFDACVNCGAIRLDPRVCPNCGDVDLTKNS